MAMHQPRFDRPRLPKLKRRRFRRIPVRTLAPNVVTLLALCAGLTAIRMAFEHRNDLALAAVVFAAVLDGIDGRLARLLKGTSRFGAELDSLADFVNFGVAPALILYFWGLHDLKSAGWIAAMVFAICAGLRLARFNVMIDDPGPARLGRQFLRRRAGAGRRHHGAVADLSRFPRPAALVVLNWLTLVYTLGIASLMVSRLPVFSGKRVGKRVPPELVGPLVVVVVLFFALLISYPWVVLTRRHRALSRQPAVRMAVLSRARPQDERREWRDGARRAADTTMPAPPLAPSAGPRQDDEPERPSPPQLSRIGEALEGRQGEMR